MKKIRKRLAVFSLIFASTCLFTSATVVQAETQESNSIKNGIFIGGIEVSGMSKEEAVSAMETYLQTLNEKTITLEGPNGSIDISFANMGISANIDAVVEEALEVGTTGSLVSRFKALTDLKTESYVVDMGLSLDKQKTAQIIYDNLDTLNIEAKDYGLKRENGQFISIEGQAGDEVDIVASVNALLEYVAGNWENSQGTPETVFELTSVQTNPRGSAEELATVKDVLGSFSTSFSSSGASRVQNVTTGCEKINGTLLYPGDILSVYELVSPFTKENGYELAGSYLNGQTVESFGGGICQVSTTLYNAALNAELEIVERFNHSMTVSYVNLSADAAIAGTYKDLKFKNPYDTPVYVEGYCSGRTLVFNIYGKETRAENRKVRYESETISTENPATQYVLSSSAALGSYRSSGSKHTGYVAKLWKVVEVDGVETERTQVNKSTYRATGTTVTIGTAGATPEQLAKIQSAVATKDAGYIQSIVKSLTVVTPSGGTDSNTNGNTTPSGGTDSNTSGNTTPSGGTDSNTSGNTTPSGGTDSNTSGNTTPSGGTDSNTSGNTTPSGGTDSNTSGNTTPSGGTDSNTSGNTTPSTGTSSENGATTPDSGTTQSGDGAGA